MAEVVTNLREPAPSSPPGGRPGAGLAISLALRLLSVGPLLILIVLVAGISLLTPNFLKPVNISNILAQTAVIAIVAIGQHLVILTRGIDLSVGANLALATVVGGLVFRTVDSAAVGGDGDAAHRRRWSAPSTASSTSSDASHILSSSLSPRSASAGASRWSWRQATRRCAACLTGSSPIGGSETFGVPNSFLVVLVVAGAALFMTKAMVWGRWIYAVGGDPEAAVEMGIPVRGVLISTYVISGLCAGIGGVVLAGRTGASSPLFGNLLELDTIAAVIIGGASFLGGRGHIGHALVGAVMIGVIRNALNLLNVDVFFQMIAIGLIIVVAVEADVLRNHLEGRARNIQAARTQ